MSPDYTPTMVTEDDVRSFFTPPLDYNDVRKKDILLKIESVEKYVSTVYGITSSDGRIPCLLLIAAKVIMTPGLAKKYYTLGEEKLGDYSYVLAQPISRGTDIQSSPFVISKTWEKMAIEILEELSNTTSKWPFTVVND